MQDNSASGVRSACALPVRLLRVAKGQRALLLALSREIGGFAGHWDGKFFQACRQRHGRCKWCGEPLAWRGYFAALAWSDSGQRWEPRGVEVTDRDELILRAQYRRGTRWSFFRPWPVGTRNQRLQIELRGAHEQPHLPEPFDFLDLVRQLYQYPELLLDTPNPASPEVHAHFSQPAAPLEAQPEPQPEAGGPLPHLVDEVNRRFGPGVSKNGAGNGRE